MRILLVTDAWKPQVNGVVRTLATVVETLERRGHTVKTVTPDQFRTLPCPTYPEIRLTMNPFGPVRRAFDSFAPEAVHIATEGPLGFAAWRLCRRRAIPFTTSFHTKFPEYLHSRLRLPIAWGYAWIRRFHAKAARVMVATATIERELQGWGFTNTVRWTRGVDTELFRPRPEAEVPEALRDLPRPLLMYVGRVSVEKNIAAFLDSSNEGTKIVVGDGPQRASLTRDHPDAVFVGEKYGEDLAQYYAAADAFVFPSRTDTFGLVLLEALASGTPVAAYPVPGPLDVVGDSPAGCLDDNLTKATAQALSIDRALCRQHALGFSWDRCVDLFESYLEPVAPPQTIEPAPAAS